MFGCFGAPQLEVYRCMVGGHQHIPCSVKEHLVVMSGYMRPSQIARVTHINIRTVQRVLALALQTGSVVRKPLQAGRPRELNTLDANVDSITHLPIVQFLTSSLSTLKLVYSAPRTSTLMNCRSAIPSHQLAQGNWCWRSAWSSLLREDMLLSVIADVARWSERTHLYTSCHEILLRAAESHQQSNRQH
jgi:hypothetical protein